MHIGTDIIQINRIENSLNRFGDGFKRKFLSKGEMQIAKKIETIAGFWAAKEAIAKALGCGIGSKLKFHDIVISKDSNGTPCFRLSKSAQNLHAIRSSSLSISHDGGFAIAVAIIKK